MNNRLIKKIISDYCYFAAPIITLAALLAVFFNKGVVPFGSLSVEYYDMAPASVPTYYHVWDALHRSDVALWFNWYSGLGVNNSIVSLSFFWIVLLFIKRSAVNAAMTLYVAFSFALSSFTSAVFLKKVTKANQFIITALSVCYAFCGFSVLYYTNMWQDTVILFPLLMLAWHELMHKGKSLPFIIMTVLNLLCGYYTFTLLMMYIFFMSFVYLRLQLKKEERKPAALRLGASVLLGFGISGAALLPKYMQALTSGRFLDKTGFNFSDLLSQYLEIAKTIEAQEHSHYRLFFSMLLPLALIVTAIIRERKKGSLNKKEIAFFSLSMLFILVLAFCEGSNGLMHLGDYKYFPIRTGFAFSFITVWFGAVMSESLSFNKIKTDRSNAVLIVINAVLFAVLFCGVYIVTRKTYKHFPLKLSKEIGFKLIIAAVIIFVLYLIIINIKSKRLDYRVFMAVLLAEVMALTAIYIPYQSKSYTTLEHNPSYITKAVKLADYFNIEESKTSRIKSVGTVLNSNFGTVIGRATVCDWTHLIPSNVQSELKKWSYTAEYTRLSDSGGTAFSDALLGIDSIISTNEEPPLLYELVSTKGNYNYYKSKYTIPYGFVNSKLDKLDTADKSWQEIQNSAYTALTDDSEPLITESGYALTLDEGDVEYYTFNSTEGSVAYLELEGAAGVKIYVNGKQIAIPSVAQPNNKSFPGKFNRGIICLGEFGDSTIEIKLEFTKGKYEENKNFRKNSYGKAAYRNQNYMSNVSLLNVEKLEKVCSTAAATAEEITISAKNYSLTAENVKATNGDSLIIPLQFSKNSGWTARVNGKPAEIEEAAGILSAIPLEAGINSVEFKFVPRGLKAGAIISAVSLALLAAYLLIEKRFKRLYAFLGSAAEILYTAAFYAGIVIIYAIPLCYKLIYIVFIK